MKQKPTDFETYLQWHIDHTCSRLKATEGNPMFQDLRRVLIVVKHSLIDFSRILKGRASAQESLWKGGPCERQTALMTSLRQELIPRGFPQKEKGQKKCYSTS